MIYNTTEILEKGSCDITSVNGFRRPSIVYDVYIPTLWSGCRCYKVLTKSNEVSMQTV